MNDSRSSVIPLSPDLPYEDGSEDQILQILREATDRSAGSDELASHITDWPTRYHLSRLRQNLFMPFQFSSQHRVLEIGCGTGANVRVIAETGAEVIGVEGTYVRALAARTRCEGMENVTIYAGDANDLPDIDLFDAVLLIGVLEYSGASVGGRGGPDLLLQTARKHLKDGGQLILAIENQLGLKYLLSYPEDHLGLPWIGVEGYRNTNGVRTWSRAQLSKLLERNGFVNQEWMFPFPDYKLPTFVASEELFNSENGRHLVKNVLRSPVVDYSGSRAIVCDSTSAFQTMVDAHLGPDISNSFLISAMCTSGHSRLLDRNDVGWLASGERLTKWRRYRTITKISNQLVFRSSDSQPMVVEEDWLSNVKEAEVPFVSGIPLDDLIIQTLAANDLTLARDYLNMYRGFLEQNSDESTPTTKGPFAPNIDSRSLPPEFLDCTPKNLLWTTSTLKFIDKEWVASNRLDLDQIWIRGLCELVNEMITRGSVSPFDPKETLVSLVRHLSALANVDIQNGEIINFLQKSEQAFQEIVSKSVPAGHFEYMSHLSLWDVRNSLPILSQMKRIHTLEVQNQQLEQQRLIQDNDLHNLQLQIDSISRSHDALSKKSDRQLATIALLRSQIGQIRQSSSFRIGRLMVRPFGLFKRILKSQK